MSTTTNITQMIADTTARYSMAYLRQQRLKKEMESHTKPEIICYAIQRGLPITNMRKMSKFQLVDRVINEDVNTWDYEDQLTRLGVNIDNLFPILEVSI